MTRLRNDDDETKGQINKQQCNNPWNIRPIYFFVKTIAFQNACRSSGFSLVLKHLFQLKKDAQQLH